MKIFLIFLDAANALELRVGYAGSDRSIFLAVNSEEKFCGAFSLGHAKGTADTFWIGGAAYDNEEAAISALFSGHNR